MTFATELCARVPKETLHGIGFRLKHEDGNDGR
jgi:hypothetical protein